MRIPEGLSEDKVLEALRAYKNDDAGSERARTWSLVYYFGKERAVF